MKFYSDIYVYILFEYFLPPLPPLRQKKNSLYSLREGIGEVLGHILNS